MKRDSLRMHVRRALLTGFGWSTSFWLFLALVGEAKNFSPARYIGGALFFGASVEMSLIPLVEFYLYRYKQFKISGLRQSLGSSCGKFGLLTLHPTHLNYRTRPLFRAPTSVDIPISEITSHRIVRAFPYVLPKFIVQLNDGRELKLFIDHPRDWEADVANLRAASVKSA